nr:hypothetical protein [Bacteroides intestinalis]
MKQYINIDKLEVSFDFNDRIKDYLENNTELNFNSFFLLRQNNRNNNYKNYFEIYLFDNTLFGSLYFGSYNINRQKIYISVDNRMLYTNNLSILYTISEELNLEINSISKLDLALDFTTNIVSKFYRLLKNRDLNFIILNKKYVINDEVKNLFTISNGTRTNIHRNKSFYIQNREKGLTLCGYNKIKEILDNNNEKQYIKELINSNRIYRLEIRTNHSLLLDSLKKIGFTDLYLYQILISRDNSELFVLYNHLLNRLIRLEYENKIYSLLDFISK